MNTTEHLKSLVEAQDQYIAFLGEHLDGMAGFFVSHPHMQPDQATCDRGQELRDKIEALRQKLNG